MKYVSHSFKDRLAFEFINWMRLSGYFIKKC